MKQMTPERIAACKEVGMKFVDEFNVNNDTSFLCIGVGLNRAGDDAAILVLVRTDEDKQKLPATYDGMEVIVDVVGDPVAFGEEGGGT